MLLMRMMVVSVVSCAESACPPVFVLSRLGGWGGGGGEGGALDTVKMKSCSSMPATI